MAATAALVGFTACSNSDDDDGGPGASSLAAFTHKNPCLDMMDTIYFCSDNTWVRECVFPAMNNYTEKDMRGTYSIASGDFTNGTLNFTVVEHNGNKKGCEKFSLEIKDGVFYLDADDNPVEVGVDTASSCDKYVKQ